ncbi:diphosphomevalonate decarboxylase [Labilibacter sediminis]|nr:diphosphomevalonate decarboxylase [Labilibacter sediminis]
MNFDQTDYKCKSGEVTYQCPSNIAIVKYWGKTDIQLPVNPSVSFTLKNAVTSTYIKYAYQHNQKEFSFNFLFEGKQNTSFEEKLKVFFSRVSVYFPWLNHYHLNIRSENTFPHSSGIASSASSFAALAISLGKIHQQITNQTYDSNIISECARLGSGSASRSVYGGWVRWGKTSELHHSSNQYAIPVNDAIHPVFKSIQDSILIVSKEKKAISSTAGHQLMENHPYKQGRITQANNHTKEIIKALKDGDMERFIEITESEALSLHGLMMSSTPGYTLLLPESLKIIELIREFRKTKNIPICFTIDAGPNIHVLYPAANKKEVQEFIEKKLLRYCTNNICIDDEIGLGPIELNK